MKRDLREFLLREMRMTGIYQPVVIRELIKSSNGEVSLEKLAGVIATEDPSSIEYYVQILKAWPHKTLKKRGICHIPPLSEKFKFFDDVKVSKPQKNELISICNQKITEWLKKRADDVADPSGWGRLRAELLTKTPRCELCGAKPTAQNGIELDIDHIIPVSKGGKDHPENLQVLCHRCNRGKGNKMLMSVAEAQKAYDRKRPSCIFCNLDRKPVSSNEHVFAILDKYPVTKGHHLIVPQRHVELATDLKPYETHSILDEAKRLCKMLEKKDRTIKGFNLGFNVGEVSGQTVMHAHFHVIPRRSGDVGDPTGGIRSVIPGKKTY